MKECLHCSKEFEPKKPTKKFCSDSCRVMYHRKHGKKNEIKPFQMQVLYNSFLELSERMKEGMEKMALPTINISQPNSVNLATGFIAKIKSDFKSAEQWHELKRGCESAEEWEKVKEQIIDAENLSPKQKQIIINTP